MSMIVPSIMFLLMILIAVLGRKRPNRISNRLFVNHPPLYNSPSKLDNIDFKDFSFHVELPIDSRYNYFGEIAYKKCSVREVEEFLQNDTTVEIQRKIMLDLEKFNGSMESNINNTSIRITPTIEVFYPYTSGVLWSKSFAKVRLSILVSNGTRTVMTKTYEDFYLTNGLDSAFEGSFFMTIEQGANVTIGMTLRSVLDQFYTDLSHTLKDKFQ